MFLSAFLFVLPFLLGIPLLLLLTLPFSWKEEQPPTSDSVASLRRWWEDRPVLRFCRRVYSIPGVLWSVLPISAHVSEMGNYVYVPPKDHFSTYTVFPTPREFPFVLQPGAVPPAPPLVQPAVIPPAPSAEMALFKVKDHHVKVLKTQLQSKDGRLRELETQLQSKDGRLRELEEFAPMVHREFGELSTLVSKAVTTTRFNMDLLKNYDKLLSLSTAIPGRSDSNSTEAFGPLKVELPYIVAEDMYNRQTVAFSRAKWPFLDSNGSLFHMAKFTPKGKGDDRFYYFSSGFDPVLYAKALNLGSLQYPFSPILDKEFTPPHVGTVQPGLGRFLNFNLNSPQLPPELWSKPYGLTTNPLTNEPLTNRELFFHKQLSTHVIDLKNWELKNEDEAAWEQLKNENKLLKESKWEHILQHYNRQVNPFADEGIRESFNYYGFIASHVKRLGDERAMAMAKGYSFVHPYNKTYFSVNRESAFRGDRVFNKSPESQQPEPRGLAGKEELPPGPPAPLESSALAELLGSLGQTGGIALPITLKFMALAYWYVLLAFLLLSLFRSLFPRSSILEEEDWVLQFGALVPIPPLGPRPLLRFIYAPLWIMVFSVSGGMAPAYFRALVVSPLVAVVTPVLLGLFFPVIVLRCWTPGTEKVLSPGFEFHFPGGGAVLASVGIVVPPTILSIRKRYV